MGRLRAVRKAERLGEKIVVSGADPLNLVGTLLPGVKVPRLPVSGLSHRIVHSSARAGPRGPRPGRGTTRRS